jgi:hypothetical protein
MIEFYIYHYPKFTETYIGSKKFEGWDEALRFNGYPSTKYHANKGVWTMDEKEFILFALKWS